MSKHQETLETTRREGELARVRTLATVAVSECSPEEQAIKAKLLEIWRSIFKNQTISSEDDFFALGGHSLLAAKLLARIHKALGKELSLASLLTAPTVAGQAKLLCGGWQPKSAPHPFTEVAVKKTFVLLGADPTFRPLLRRLERSLPVRTLGLNSSLLAELKNPDSFEEIASLCRRELRKQDVGDDLVLCGWCDKGLLAFEMARQLQAEGSPPPLVMMLQTSNPAVLSPYPKWKRFISRTQLRLHLAQSEYHYMRHLGGKHARRYFLGRLGQTFSVLRNWWGLNADVVDPETDEHFARDYFDILHRAGELHRPSTYEGRVILFRGRKKSFGFAAHADLGWRSLLGDRLEVCEVAGNHFSMFIPPFDEELSSRMLERIQAPEK